MYVKVIDETGSSTFVLWHKDCCKLLMTTPEDILKNSISPEDVLGTLEKKQLLFKVQINSNNIQKLYRQSYSVSKVCDDKKVIEKFVANSTYEEVILTFIFFLKKSLHN